ncbi:MAG: hypothetical protein J6W84_02405 [Bacteroidales bacterium]|nr:hypothetical protein [Bacteroidales bacterium]
MGLWAPFGRKQGFLNSIGIYCKLAIFFDFLAGFSTITLYAYNHEIRVHGFLQREVGEMKRGEGKNKQSFFSIQLNKNNNFVL